MLYSSENFIGVYHAKDKANDEDQTKEQTKAQTKDQTKDKEEVLMAKRTQAENFAISQKVELLMQEGFEEDQATAIAFRMFRDGELKIIEQRMPTQARKEQNAMRTAKTANAIYQLFKLVMKR